MSSALYILSFLNEGDTVWLLQSGETESMPAGAVLIREGQPVENLYIVLDGELSISVDALGGKEVARRGRGQIVGEMSFIEVGRPSATVRVREDATLFRIARATLAAKLRLDLGFASRFYHALAVLVSERLRDSQAGHLSQTSKRRDDTPDPQASAGAAALSNVFLASGRLDRLLARLSHGADVIVLTGNDLTIEHTLQVAYHHNQVAISPFAREQLIAARRCVDRLAMGPDPIYGLTTGLGALKDQRVAPDRMDQYQRNVLMSHAVGVGPDFDEPTVRASMMARLNGMARGGSGIRPSVFDLLLAMLNAGIHPIVPSRGSIGMADLSPLAHLSLPLIGLGEVIYQGRRMPSGAALEQAGLQPISLAAKDGHALVCANSASVGRGALLIGDSIDLLACAEVAVALSLEAFQGNVGLLDDRIHTARPYSGQLASAECQRALLAGSYLWQEVPNRSIQDPLSFRCVTQVHGACRDTLAFVRTTVETELNATSDNPVVLADEERIVSNGNFHPAGLALGFDSLAIVLGQLSSLATSRTLKLHDPKLSNLPPQLTATPGINTGFGVLQKTVTALNAETRTLANPASLDFIPVASQIEDHATNATLSVDKAARIVDNCRYILAIELLTAAQAIDLRGRPELGAGTAAAFAAVRSVAPFLCADDVMAPHVEAVYRLLLSGDWCRRPIGRLRIRLVY